MSETVTKDPIITETEAEELNEKFQEALSQHLFLFCHYKPIPENPQNYSARFIAGVLNLFIFCCDSCFFLRGLEKLFKEYVFEDRIPNNIYKSICSIEYNAKKISALRTTIAHNGTDRSERWYINWVKEVLNNKYPPGFHDYALLCDKLDGMRNNLLQSIKKLINEIAELPSAEKNKLISAWENKIIEVFARQHNNRYRDQLKLVYFSQSGNEPNDKELKGWIDDSIGFKLRTQEKDLKDEKNSLEEKLAKKEHALFMIKELCDKYPDDESLKSIKKNAEKDLLKHKEKLAKIYDCLAKTKEQIEEINKDKENAYENKKTATDFFFSRVKDQMKQTLNEIKESEDSFTMFPECFIQIDIQKNFPLCNHS